MDEQPSNRVSNGAKANWKQWNYSNNNCQANDGSSFRLEIEEVEFKVQDCYI